MEKKDLQDPFAFTNSAKIQFKDGEPLFPNNNAYGVAKPQKRKNNSSRKFLVSLVTIALVSGVIASYSTAYDDTVERMIATGEISNVLNPYNSSGGPSIEYKGPNGEIVYVTPKDVIKTVVDSISNSSSIKR